MEHGGWVKDPHLIHRFTQSKPTSQPKSTIPKSVKTGTRLYGPIVKLFNALAVKSILSFVDTSGNYPQQSQHSSHLKNWLPVSNESDALGTSELCPDILGMHKHDIDAFLGAREDRNDTWLYWKLVRMFCKVKLGFLPGD